MNTRILNREFQHPSDGWYMIEPKGEHPNRRNGVIQVIDDVASETIVNRFNADADAGRLSHGHEMLIDHEHFKHDQDKETRAYGWLQKMQNRSDGYYGQVRWTGTGKQSVDDGDYRFFSTEYDPADLKVLNEGRTRRVRPLRLDGLTLTNDPNNKGGRPITNRSTHELAALPADKRCPDCKSALQPFTTTPGIWGCPECHTNFASASASADSKQQPTVKNTKMKTVCTLLGLSAEADEQSVHAAVSKLLNRGEITSTDLATLRNEHKALGESNVTLLTEQVDGLLAEHGVKDAKVINRLRPILVPMKNRADREECLVELLGLKPGETAKPAARVLNRGTGSTTAQAAVASDAATQEAEAERATKIMNRASVIQKDTPGISLATAVTMASKEIK